jgi:hypothetical protein
MTTFKKLVPVWWSGQDQAAETQRFVELYFDAQRAGLDPVVGIETTPDGDVWVLEFEDSTEGDQWAVEGNPDPGDDQ